MTTELEDVHPLEKEISYDNITEVDLFLENCSSLYNLILDAIHDLSSKTLTCQRLEEMSAAVAEAGRRLAIDQPDVDGVVALRINTISSALEQLRLRKAATSDTESCSSRSQCSSEIRNWIHHMEKRLADHEETLLLKKSSRPVMTKLMADQQVLQLEIQTEGQSLVSRLYHQLKAECDVTSEIYNRRKSTADAIRKRWHTVYLNSLSLQFRIEELLNKSQEDSDSESDEDLQAPPNKRARRSSAVSDEADDEDDTLPFAESEYESIMDGRATVTSVSSEDSPLRARKWDSVQQDIGYSSGENSVHEALNTLADTEKSVLTYISPSKMYYRMALDDVSDVEVKKAMDLKFLEDDAHNRLSESMHVNYDLNASLALPEYDEVMALLDEEDGKVARSDSFNTQWKEIHGQASVRKQRNSDIIDAAKHSCDASSEDSSDWEGPDLPDIMSRSLNSALLGGSTYSLKRQRSASKKNSQQLLDCSEMEASFCSTRSDLPPCLGRSLRKKLRVRRMPRSMSDGEQLGVKSGLLTPRIRVSPPGTPLSSSTKLLQQLDNQLLANDSDTAPEQSDAPAYEWDDYRPPEKDDSMPDGMSFSQRRSTEELFGDDDFNSHFSGLESTRRLADESRAHLKVVEKYVENEEVDSRQVENIELICRTNLRQLDAAIRLSVNTDISDLRDLRQQWSRLLHNISSPASQLLQKVGRFATSLRDLHGSSSAAVLSTMSEIRSKEDAGTALEAIRTIQKRLSGERDELRCILDSKTFRTELSEVSGEFETISKGYDEAVYKIDTLVESLQKLNADWSDWNAQQKSIRQCMASIEERLKTANFDQSAVLDQMEYCQERMNSLETMCNYLTTSLCNIQDDGNNSIAPDFRAEISLYSNALDQLRSKFNELIRVPTPPTPSMVIPPVPMSPISPIATSTPQKAQKRVRTRETQTRSASPKREEQPLSLGSHVYKSVSSSRLVKSLLILSLVSALAALFWAGILGASFGPHLTYVRGPPPV